MHHHNAAVAHLGIEHRGAKANEAVVANVGGAVDQRQVSNAGIIANPHRVELAIVTADSALL